MVGSVVANVAKYGVGGLAIEACRIPSGDDYGQAPPQVRFGATAMGYMGGHQTRPWVQAAIAAGKPVKEFTPSAAGRWPTNVILIASKMNTLAGLDVSRYFKVVANGK